MDIHERDGTKQEDINILLEKIYPYLRYGEIAKAFDLLDEAIDENKNSYEYLVEKIKLLYMLHLKEEAYVVLDANIELLYSNIDKIDVDFISRRIYYHFYRSTELDTSGSSNNFDYLKITKEFINKYGFGGQAEEETSVQEQNNDSVSSNEESINIVECFSADADYNLFGEAITIEGELDSAEAVATNENLEYLKEEFEEFNEANIFEELFATDVVEVAPPNEEQELEAETILEIDPVEETIQEEVDETEMENAYEKLVAEEIFYDDELPYEEKLEQEEFVEQAAEDIETISAEEVIIEQEVTEEEDIVIEDNPHIDVPIYLGKVDGKDVFFESMAEHVAPAKEEKPMIIIDSSQYTFTRLISLLTLGFIIGAAIVYYL